VFIISEWGVRKKYYVFGTAVERLAVTISVVGVVVAVASFVPFYFVVPPWYWMVVLGLATTLFVVAVVWFSFHLAARDRRPKLVLYPPPYPF